MWLLIPLDKRQRKNIYEAIEAHMQELLEDNLSIPKSEFFVEYVAIAEKSSTSSEIVELFFLLQISFQVTLNIFFLPAVCWNLPRIHLLR